jgi:hypothetical protein
MRGFGQSPMLSAHQSPTPPSIVQAGDGRTVIPRTFWKHRTRLPIPPNHDSPRPRKRRASRNQGRRLTPCVGCPQCGHAAAWSMNSRLHSGHLMRAMIGFSVRGMKMNGYGRLLRSVAGNPALDLLHLSYFVLAQTDGPGGR